MIEKAETSNKVQFRAHSRNSCRRVRNVVSSRSWRHLQRDSTRASDLSAFGYLHDPCMRENWHYLPALLPPSFVITKLQLALWKDGPIKRDVSCDSEKEP